MAHHVGVPYQLFSEIKFCLRILLVPVFTENQKCHSFFLFIENLSDEGRMFAEVLGVTVSKCSAWDDTKTSRALRRRVTEHANRYELSDFNERRRALNYPFSSFFL